MTISMLGFACDATASPARQRPGLALIARPPWVWRGLRKQVPSRFYKALATVAPPHQDVAGQLKMLDKMLRGNLSSQIISAAKPLAAIKAERERERLLDVVRRGGDQVGVICHTAENITRTLVSRVLLVASLPGGKDRIGTT